MKSTTHQITEFQRNFIHDRETVLEVIELLFPDCTIDWTQERGNLQINAHPCYTWVEVKYKDYLHFALNNHHATIQGKSIYGHVTNQTYSQAKFSFEVIIFNGCAFQHEVSDMRKQRVDKLLRTKGYRQPSFNEWWNEYHTDSD